MEEQIRIRRSEVNDLQHILDMIQELADYEEMSDGPKLKLQNLITDGNFNDNPFLAPVFYSFVAERQTASSDFSSQRDQQINVNNIENDQINKSSSSNVLDETRITRPLTHEIIGYTIAFFTYSTTLGKCYFIEDIYVKQEYRKDGVGQKLLRENIKFALDSGCKQLNLHVLDWNSPAINFYKKNGAIDLTCEKGTQFYRFDRKKMDDLLKFHVKTL